MANIKVFEIAQKAKVLPSTIRYYIDLGLIEIADKTIGGQHLLDEEKTLKILEKIKYLSFKGHKLNQIKEILSKGMRKKLLIVDDDSDMKELIKIILPEEEWEIRHATDGFEAGRILMEYLPDLITLDLVMPGMDGFKICQNIRKDPLTKNIKILTITAHNTPAHKEKIYNIGADGCLQKPFSPYELKIKINEVLKDSN